MLKKIIYITDLSLPSNKAQAIHIFKMIDNFLSFMDEAILIIPNLNENLKIEKIKDYFNLHTKKKIIFKPFLRIINYSTQYEDFYLVLKLQIN